MFLQFVLGLASLLFAFRGIELSEAWQCRVRALEAEAGAATARDEAQAVRLHDLEVRVEELELRLKEAAKGEDINAEEPKCLPWKRKWVPAPKYVPAPLQDAQELDPFDPAPAA